MVKTVYVVGAGASTEFGSMPIGKGLAEKIQSRIGYELRRGLSAMPDPSIIGALARRGYTAEHSRALQRIEDGIVTRDSIDDFVNEWCDQPGLPDVARFCIAYAILDAENNTRLGVPVDDPSVPGRLQELRGTWIDWVVRHTARSIPRRRLPEALVDTHFITFNYDRCIEYYLFLYLRRAIGMQDMEARQALQAITIEHVYGAAGVLPQLGGWVPFGSLDSDTLSLAASPIRTYCETIDTERGRRIRSLVDEADRLVFLGCAFHNQNLDVLFGPGGGTSAEVFATTHGLRPRAEATVREWFRSAGAEYTALHDTASGLMVGLQDELF